ncbi:RHD3/Sey1 [Lipomyces arxii]|uniref:RHD3/Sey1 n=1 Tax=Lipomyces arxii TaxID=56418 RepID=UPI0034CF3608
MDPAIVSEPADPRLDKSQVQLINENKVFSSNVNEYLAKVQLMNAGLDYHLISVFGTQSSGKSTLLNALFGTSFDVMQASRRHQTTKGIWMSRAKQDNILILDVEGTDGRERGEDQDFERKAALFALATSEVLIVNMWEVQVGLYQGASMGLLRTVFEVNLNLFSSPNKSLLLFVIRDNTTTPLTDLQATLIDDLKQNWAALSKPDAFKDSEITDFFTLQFTALPHKVLQPDAFASAVDKLSSRFESKTDGDYVFDREYHRNVPADGWNIYAQNIWEQIELNKDLDLPTQYILVARFRCEEIAGEAWDAFENDIRPVEGAAGIVAGLGSIIGPARENALEIYRSQASKYTGSVFSEREAALAAKIDARLSTIYSAQLAVLKKIAMQKFNAVISSELAKPKARFLTVVEYSKAETLELFLQVAKEAQIKGPSLSYDSTLESLNNDIEETVSRLRALEAKKLANRIIRTLSSNLDDKLSAIYDRLGPDFWDRIMGAFRAGLEDGLCNYKIDDGKYDLGLGASEEETRVEIENIRMEAWKMLYRTTREIGKRDFVLSKIKNHFEEVFKYDVDGLPRMWKPADKIDEIYSEAVKESLALLPILANAKLESGEKIYPDADIIGALERDEEVDVDRFPVLMSEGQLLQITNDFKKTAGSVYLDAKRSMIQSIKQIPVYFYLLLLALGWNEIMAVLRNPLLITVTIMACGFLFVAYRLNLIGPMLSVGNAAVGQALDLAKEQIRGYVEVSSPSPSKSTQQASFIATSTTTTATTTKNTESTGEEIEMEELNTSKLELSEIEQRRPGQF